MKNPASSRYINEFAIIKRYFAFQIDFNKELGKISNKKNVMHFNEDT